MGRLTQMRRKILAGVVAFAMVASLAAIAVTLLSGGEKPTLSIDGIELRLREDGSIQALASVSVSNQENVHDLNLLLHYNTDYMQISDWKTNQVFPTGGIKTDDPSAEDLNDPLHHLFFHTDEALYNGGDPFVWRVPDGGGTGDNAGSIGIVMQGADRLSLFLALDEEIPKEGLIGKVANTDKNGNVTKEWSMITYPEGENRVSVGTISFRVNEDKLAELIEKFDNSDGRGNDEDKTLLLESYAEGENSWSIGYLQKKQTPTGTSYQTTPLNANNNGAEFKISINFIDALVHAEPVDDSVTINSYEAYTNGQISDLALAMQKYADSIRVTHASGTQADQSMYWGDPATAADMPAAGPGMMFEDKADGGLYRFTWAANGTDYTLEKVTKTTVDNGDGTSYDTYDFSPSTGMTRGADGCYTYTFADGSTYRYDATGGSYHMSQYFTYLEEAGIPGSGTVVRKTYTVNPMEVDLTVTPVTLTKVEVDNKVLTYPVGSVPYTYYGLDLAEKAKLTLDTVLSGVTPTMYIDWTPNNIYDVKQTVAGVEIHWPTEASEDLNDRAGDYPFKTDLKKPAIQSTYPWLTVPQEVYDLDSLRRIVAGDNTEWPWAKDFEMRAEADDESGDLLISIVKKTSDGSGYEDIPADTYKVDLYQPDGTYIDPAWFTTDTSGSGGAFYTESINGFAWAGDKQGISIRIHTNAFGAASDGNAALRDILQQNINLGGWFGAELELKNSAEDPKPRTDRITAYSDPRRNIYLKNYVLDLAAGTARPPFSDLSQPLFDFTGTRSGLLPVYPGVGLSTLVTLPNATEDARSSEWVAVRYDAASGVEPGYIRQFKVDPKAGTTDEWPNVTAPTDGVVTYGYVDDTTGDPFARDYTYSGDGQLLNPVDKNRQVKVKVQLQDDKEEKPTKPEGLLLTYEQYGDGITYIHNDTFDIDEVKRVVFNTRQVGYTYQQVVTLTLTNRGDEEVKGIYIDTSDTTKNPLANYFTILSAPAVNLAPGASTTFQVSYEANLPIGKYLNTDLDTVPIRIYSSHYSGTDPIKTFEAELEVTKDPVYEVRLIVRPEDRSMGDAGFVTGVDTLKMYDSTAKGNTYPAGDPVWVLTLPKDEFALISAPYYYNGEYERNEVTNEFILDEDGNPIPKKVYLTEYLPEDLDPTSPSFRSTDGEERLFLLDQMPGHSIAIYVDYYEPIYSKLRLSDLDAYAWPWPSSKSTGGKGPDWTDPSYEQELRDDQSGGYDVILFDPDKAEYLVILDDEDESCGVAVTLRNVIVPLNALGKNIELKPVEVVMTVDGGIPIYNNEAEGDTSVPTVHQSNNFDAPLPGKSRTVTVSVTFDDRGRAEELGDTHIYEGQKVTRTYKVRFVKKYTGEPDHDFHPGNSPYGMIENDDTIKDKDAAKRDFDNGTPGNAFTFTPGLTPVKATTSTDLPAGTSLSNIYWGEAWGDGVNYDKVESALFVYVGKDFYDPGVSNIYNNAGDLIVDTEVERTLTYIPLTSKSALKDKFNGDTTTAVTISLGTAMVGSGDAAGCIPGELLQMKDGDNVVDNIRPGVYQLTYRFLDYDGQTYLSFVRPFIILVANGDVDANLTVATEDRTYIQNRLARNGALPMDSANYPVSDALVYRYRILDANNDRNINNIDANLIRQRLATKTSLTEFYCPIDYINKLDDSTTDDTTTP